jgi:deazaflavin-dependent oxidoreductase (nitroreductase family)
VGSGNPPNRRIGLAQRALQRLPASAGGSKFFAATWHHVDDWALSVTNGRWSLSQWAIGLPIVTVQTTGAKSGLRRDIVTAGIPDGADTILIASNYGGEKHPAWYHNLRAHPEVTLVAVRSEPRAHRARLLEGDERAAAWELACWHYGGYRVYAERTSRTIGVFRLSPID